MSGLASGVAGAFGVNNLNNRAGYSAEYEQYMALGNEIISFIDFRRNGYGQAAGAYGAVPGQYYTGQQPGQPYGAQPGYSNMAGQPYANQSGYTGAAGQPYGTQPGYNGAAGQPYANQPGYTGAAGQPYASQQVNNGTVGQTSASQQMNYGAPAQSCDAQPQPSGGVVRKVPCPFCGEMTTPSADGRCEFCLGKVF